MAIAFQYLRRFGECGIGEFRRRDWRNRSRLSCGLQHDLADADRVEMKIIQKAVLRQDCFKRKLRPLRHLSAQCFQDRNLRRERNFRQRPSSQRRGGCNRIVSIRVGYRFARVLQEIYVCAANQIVDKSDLQKELWPEQERQGQMLRRQRSTILAMNLRRH